MQCSQHQEYIKVVSCFDLYEKIILVCRKCKREREPKQEKAHKVKNGKLYYKGKMFKNLKATEKNNFNTYLKVLKKCH